VNLVRMIRSETELEPMGAPIHSYRAGHKITTQFYRTGEDDTVVTILNWDSDSVPGFVMAFHPRYVITNGGAYDGNDVIENVDNGGLVFASFDHDFSRLRKVEGVMVG